MGLNFVGVPSVWATQYVSRQGNPLMRQPRFKVAADNCLYFAALWNQDQAHYRCIMCWLYSWPQQISVVTLYNSIKKCVGSSVYLTEIGLQSGTYTADFCLK